MEKVLSAVVAGHICLDIIPGMQAFPPGGFQDAFQPGRLIEVDAAALSTGGPVSNTGLALHRLGIPTRLICKIGAEGVIGRWVVQDNTVYIRWADDYRVGGRCLWIYQYAL